MSEQTKQLLSLFMHLEGMLHRHMTAGRRGPLMNPHRGQGRILSILKLKPEITQKELTFLLDMSKQALGELLGKLENCGYITRTPSEEDGRVMLITLTEAGQDAADKIGQEDDTEDLFQCLTEEEQDSLANYLERLIESWQKDMDMGRPCMERRRRPDPRTPEFPDPDEEWDQAEFEPGHEPEHGPHHGPGHGPEHGSHHGLEHGPGHGPHHGLEHGPGHGPHHGLEHGPGHGPHHGPEHGPHHGPEHRPHHEPGHGPYHGPEHDPEYEPTHRPEDEPEQRPEHELES